MISKIEEDNTPKKMQEGDQMKHNPSFVIEIEKKEQVKSLPMIISRYEINNNQ